MRTPHEKVRRHGKVHELPDEVRAEVDSLLLEDTVTYADIVEFLEDKGYSISSSAVGRYGQDFMNQIRRLRQVEDKAKALVSAAGGSGLVLEEAASKLFARDIISALLDKGIDVKKSAKLIMGFASLQRASIAREKFKSDMADKTATVAEKIEKTLRKKGLSAKAVNSIKKQILGIAS